MSQFYAYTNLGLISANTWLKVTCCNVEYVQSVCDILVSSYIGDRNCLFLGGKAGHRRIKIAERQCLKRNTKNTIFVIVGLVAFIEQKQNDNNGNLCKIHGGLYFASALLSHNKQGLHVLNFGATPRKRR